MNHVEHSSGNSTARADSSTRRAPLLIARLCVWAAWCAVALFAVGQFSSGWTEALLSPWPLVFAMSLMVLALVTAVSRRWISCTLAVAAAAWAFLVWLPPVIAQAPAPTAVATSKLRVVEANVNCLTQPTPEVVAWIQAQSADLVVIVECTPAWQAALDTALNTLPFRLARSAESPSGIALYSAHPLANARVVHESGKGRGRLETDVETHSGAVHVVALHTLSPVRPSRAYVRNAELQELALQLQPSVQAGTPTIVVGDCNETPWGATFADFVRVSGLHSALQGWGAQGTWHRGLPALLRVPIDHCFISPNIQCGNYAVGAPNDSDHLPIVVDLLLP